MIPYDPDIFDAVVFGDLESIKMYWQNDINVNYQEKRGATMLMLAAYYGFEDIVEYLMSKGADLSLKNTEGQTAMEIAQQNGHPGVVKLIEMRD